MREMKDSGVEWIGEIPITWKCCKQKYEVTLLNGRAYKDNEFEEDGKYPILRVGNLFSNPVWYSSSLELPQDKYCNSGDLLYSWSMSYSPIIWEGPKVIYHYHIWKTILSDSVYKKFVYYYMKALTDALKAEIHETTMGFITMGVMNNSYFAFPTKSEQRSIANYLDQKCSEIDAITKDIQTQIDTLEQYKRSVITEAVTKGLDPDVELKDSGIEWIGKISSDFRITHLKYVCLVLDGHRKPIAADKRTQNAEKLYDYYGASGVIDQIDGYTIDDDVLLIGEDGANLVLRNLPLIYQVHGKAWINNHAHILKPKNELNYYYAYYMLESLDIHIYITGSAQPKFNQLALLNMFIILPPYKKQCEIAHYLNTKCTEIDEIIAEKNKQLNILADYKKSLIFEYVTGKKEVPSA